MNGAIKQFIEINSKEAQRLLLREAYISLTYNDVFFLQSVEDYVASLPLQLISDAITENSQLYNTIKLNSLLDFLENDYESIQLLRSHQDKRVSEWAEWHIAN